VHRPHFATADGVLLAGERRLAAGTPRAVVVVVHGFSASADHPEVRALADRLHANTIDVLTYDARGHGRSAGMSTLGDLELHDVAAVVDVARLRIDRVVLVGASMGAIAALRYAAGRDDLAGVVSVSCPARWRLPRNARGVIAAGMTRTRLGRAVAARFLRVRVARRWANPDPPVALVSRVRVPLALVHGTADRFIPTDDARRLRAAAHPPCRLDVVTGMGHGFDATGASVIADAVEWTLALASQEGV